MDHIRLFETIREEILSVAMTGIRREDVTPESRLVEDLGVDSFKFVELTVGLESALELEEFPMQQWIDERMSRDEPITVHALVLVSERLLARAHEPAEVHA